MLLCNIFVEKKNNCFFSSPGCNIVVDEEHCCCCLSIDKNFLTDIINYIYTHMFQRTDPSKKNVSEKKKFDFLGEIIFNQIYLPRVKLWINRTSSPKNNDIVF